MGIESHKYREPQMTIQRTGGKWSARALMLYNLLFWASGVVLVIIGIWVQVDPRRSYVLRLVHLSEREPYLVWVAWICIITGVFTLLIGFVSCGAAVKRLRCMTATFILFLVVFFMADIAIATLALIYRDQFTLDYTKLYLTNMTQNRYSRDYWVQPLLDTIQFYAARAWSIQPIDPMCITYHYNQTAFRSSVYVEGCYERLHKWLNDMTLMFAVLGFSFAAFMFVGIIISLCLCNSIRYYVQVEEY